LKDLEFATVAIDAHGGDQGLPVTVPSAIQALREDPRIRLVLCGRQDELVAALKANGQAVSDRLQIAHASAGLAMDAKPTAALRCGKNSSMWRAIELLADGKVDASVSSGSTAALMTVSVKLLGLLPGIERPAIMAHVPNGTGFTGMLDLGANLQVSARQLAQFAVMGAVSAEVADGIKNPRVGLLNVGHEDNKGHEGVRAASEILKALSINYIGFIEGHDIYSGKVDVAVCDGFTGNLMIKSSEGLARMLVGELHRALDSSLLSRAGAWMASAALRAVLAQIDPAAHNGAPLLGLNGVVVKSHGSADAPSMIRAIIEAGREARRKVPEKISVSIQAFQMEKET
jgi:glycerol-3-phosphate acyltransferase PlsX